jgi:hypothetical protein
VAWLSRGGGWVAGATRILVFPPSNDNDKFSMRVEFVRTGKGGGSPGHSVGADQKSFLAAIRHPYRLNDAAHASLDSCAVQHRTFREEL